MKTRDFQNLTPEQISAMSKEELLDAITKPMDAARKRLSNLKKAGFDKTPATMGFNEAGGTYKMGEVNKLTLNKIRSRARALQKFLNVQTSTPAGAKKWLSHVQASMTEEQKLEWDNLNDTQKSNVWAEVDFIRGNDTNGMFEKLGSDRVISIVHEILNREGNPDDFETKDAKDEYRKVMQTPVLDAVTEAYEGKTILESETEEAKSFDDLKNIVFTETEFKGAF